MTPANGGAWRWIDQPLALAVHRRMLALHGGADGVRDMALLASALARPRQRAAYDESAGIAELAAAYAFGVVRNHPFVDGNKRTGFVLAVLFGELNGARFVADQRQAAEQVVRLAASEIDETAFANFIAAHLSG